MNKDLVEDFDKFLNEVRGVAKMGTVAEVAFMLGSWMEFLEDVHFELKNPTVTGTLTASGNKLTEIITRGCGGRVEVIKG